MDPQTCQVGMLCHERVAWLSLSTPWRQELNEGINERINAGHRRSDTQIESSKHSV